tara:strand:- start:856 stop:1608 length:753 start_codon:yes stop_codon:yes gene_type:complete
MKTKISYGIALCRYNILGYYEILLVKKQYSYHYIKLLFGEYKSITDLDNIMKNLTYEEKKLIYNGDFKQMWNKFIYSNNFNNLNLYYKKKKIYENNYLKLNYNIDLNTHCFDNLWELPKGRPKYNNEKPLNTAIREFNEETNIDINNINIIYNAHITTSLIDDNIIFKNKYYLANIKQNLPSIIKSDILKPVFKNIFFNKEISDIKWFKINDIKNLNINSKYKKRLLREFKYIINKYKKIRKKLNKELDI